MLWSRSLAFYVFAAALGGGSGVGADSVFVWKRQDGGDVTPTTTTISAIKTSSASTVPESQPTDTLGPKEDDVPVCRVNDDSPLKPFCLPENDKLVYVGESYYVTWDSDEFPINSTITIELNYFNASGNHGKSAFTSPRTPNGYGYVPITMKEEWLQDESYNNLTIYLVQIEEGQKAQTYRGPLVSLTHPPPKHYPPPPPTRPPNKLGLVVGLPVGLGLVFLITCGLCIGMRKHRQIGMGNIMGRRNKGYGSAKSRIERLGGSGSRTRLVGRGDRSIMLDDIEENSVHEDADTPGQDPLLPNQIYASDLTLINDMERFEGSTFRQDISGLKSWR